MTKKVIPKLCRCFILKWVCPILRVSSYKVINPTKDKPKSKKQPKGFIFVSNYL